MASWRVAFAVLAGAAFSMAQQVPDLSGTWQLNVAKSNWGKHPKPSNAKVVIEHREPAFKYSGSIGMQAGTESGDVRSFQFDGAIDGKEHPVTGSAGEGMMTFRRVNANTITSEMRSKDGAVIETAKMTVSADGKRLVRELKGKGPSGEVSWTEVYERQ